MELYCKKCNELLVEGLNEAKNREVIYADECDLIPEGKYIVNKDVWNFEDLEIDYLINSNSMKLKDHHKSVRLQGCCGSSGLDGLNQLCPKCNYEVGVLVADCWTPRFIGIDMSKVSLKPLW
ncbi:conserved protein of unknown function [Tenacibaculum sp. 190524A02b]|uniref:hypothetical protein n=1 Tax=Tenacibaculum vairaonense TaxID=3137860 RepID=UPI0032B2C534